MFGAVGDGLVDGERLAGPRRSIDGAHRDRIADFADQVADFEQSLGRENRRIMKRLVVPAHRSALGRALARGTWGRSSAPEAGRLASLEDRV